jgi:hypothetical protein
MGAGGRRPDRTAEFIEPAVELTDAVREPEPEQPDVPELLRTIAKLTALLPPTVTWLPLKVAGYRAGLSSEQVRKWAVVLGWVDYRREGRLIFINKASLDARLLRLGRHPIER